MVEEKAVHDGRLLYVVNQDWVVADGYTPEDKILRPIHFDGVWIFESSSYFRTMLAKGEDDEIVISYKVISD